MQKLYAQLSQDQLQALERYAGLLLEWNQKINLTAISDPQQIQVKHFLDSLSCLAVIARPGPGQQLRLVDVGSGAGFPGLVLKIAVPQLQVTLVESVRKKADFCALVIRELGLEAVEIEVERAEALGRRPDQRESYDWAVARALAPMAVLAEYLLPLVRPGGRMLAQKGPRGQEEARQAQTAFQILGGEIEEVLPISLPPLSASQPELQRSLVVVRKIGPTPDQYPRRVGVPAKRPLG